LGAGKRAGIGGLIAHPKNKEISSSSESGPWLRIFFTGKIHPITATLLIAKHEHK
jgi:hypothetical protein